MTNGDNLLVSARLTPSSLNPFHVISKTNEITVLINSYESICYNYEHKLRFTYAPTTASNYGNLLSFKINLVPFLYNNLLWIL